MKPCLWSLGLSIIFVGFAGCSGGEETEQTPSPTPPEALGESLENSAWEGWYQYADEQLEISTFLTFAVFEYKDGFWCGLLVQDYSLPGAYLGYASVSGWQVVVETDGANLEDHASIFGRVYGDLLETGDLRGWIDSVNDFTSHDPSTQPPMEADDRDFVATLMNDDSFRLDPDALTQLEVLALMGDAATTSSGNTSGEPSATEPMFASIDLPSVLLGNRYDYSGTPFNADYCAWAQESVPAPLTRFKRLGGARL